MIDIHTHFLPWVDDGPRDLAAAAALLAAHAADGIQTVVLAPDVHPGRWDNTASALSPRFEAFRRYAAAVSPNLDLRLGCTVRLVPESLPLVQADEVLYIGQWGGRSVLLVDFSDAGIPADAFDSIAFLMSHNVVPMIAHPEQNKEVKVDFLRMRPFIEAGCQLQVTAASLAGMLGQRAQNVAWQMVEAGWVTCVATGAHQRGARQPAMLYAREALRRRVGTSVADALLHDNAHQIVNAGAPLRATVGPAVTRGTEGSDAVTTLGGPVFQRLARERLARARGEALVANH